MTLYAVNNPIPSTNGVTPNYVLTFDGSTLVWGPGGGGGGGGTAKAEIPSGSINGTNVTFTLSTTPASGECVKLIIDGISQYYTTDYTVSGTTITMTYAPPTGSTIFAFYNDSSGGGGSGTVTSVGLSTDASYLTIGSSPVTLSGTITANKTTGLPANRFVATPNGSTGAADLRAIVPADIPTLNQDTTGSAAKWTTARNLAGNSVDGSADVAFANKFIVQGTTDTGLSGAQFLGALGTGLVKNTTSTGVLSIASSGTDYAPATSGSAILKGNGAGGFSSASSGTDYAPATSGSSILKGNGAGGFSSAASGTDYAPATSGSAILKGNGSGGFSNAVSATDYAPATTGSAILKGDGAGGFSSASAGTDYQAPITLTTTGTSGAATFVGNTLNIPQYTGGGGGSPGGSANQVQTNNGSGGFAGVPLTIDSNGHLITGALGTTTIAAGTGAGTSPTISISGNDMAGTITLTTGSAPATGGDVFTVTFANNYAATPKGIYLFPSSQVAAQQISTIYNSSKSTSSWVITARSIASLNASTLYSWSYLVIG